MPYEICIPLSSDTLSWPQPGHQRAAHALFFTALQEGDAALAAAVHQRPQKPFTQAILSEKQQLFWRITLLDDALYEPLGQGLTRLTGPRLHEAALQLHLAQATWQHCDYEALAAAAQPPRHAFNFLTPTTFKQKRFLNPLPDAVSCFQSWWARWHQFAPPHLGMNIAVLDIVLAHLMLGSFNLVSHLWNDGRRQMVGATGFAIFHPFQPEQVEAHWWQNINTLAAFAFYCGTGYKTGQGCGQTMPREGRG